MQRYETDLLLWQQEDKTVVFPKIPNWFLWFFSVFLVCAFWEAAQLNWWTYTFSVNSTVEILVCKCISFHLVYSHFVWRSRKSTLQNVRLCFMYVTARLRYVTSGSYGHIIINILRLFLLREQTKTIFRILSDVFVVTVFLYLLPIVFTPRVHLTSSALSPSQSPSITWV